MNRKSIITAAITVFVTILITGIMAVAFDGFKRLGNAIDYPEISNRKDSLQDISISKCVDQNELKLLEYERRSNNEAIKNNLNDLIALQREANNQRNITNQRLSRLEGKLGIMVNYATMAYERDTLQESYYVLNK